ncbi:hypothetical protein WN943_013066 [Citrus x changshan-huyou]
MFGLGNVFEMEILKSERLSMQHLAFAWECPDREIARFQIMISDASGDGFLGMDGSGILRLEVKNVLWSSQEALLIIDSIQLGYPRNQSCNYKR